MIIDIKSIYLIIITIFIMIAVGIIVLKKLINTRNKMASFLLIVEEIVLSITVIILLVLGYNAMDDYEEFISKYGEIKNVLTLMSIYFCSSQIIIFVLTSISRGIGKRKRLIKNRRIIK